MVSSFWPEAEVSLMIFQRILSSLFAAKSALSSTLFPEASNPRYKGPPVGGRFWDWNLTQPAALSRSLSYNSTIRQSDFVPLRVVAVTSHLAATGVLEPSAFRGGLTDSMSSGFLASCR